MRFLTSLTAKTILCLNSWIYSTKSSVRTSSQNSFPSEQATYYAPVRIYRGLLAEHPKDPLLLNNLAWALGQLKDPTAVEYAETANSLAPDNPAILDTLGWILVENGKDARGVELLTKASNLAPGAHAVRLHLAQALLKSGQKDAGRKQLEVLAGMSEESAIKQEAKKLLSSL